MSSRAGGVLAPGIGETLHVVCDLAQAGEPERVVADTARALGGLDVLVNNVGLARQARFEEVPDDEWGLYWQLNLMSYVRAIRAALPLMRARGRGVIVNVSSTAGKRPSTGMPHYSVTKAAVLSLSRLVADLYAKDGIRCNAVTPGPTATQAWLGEGGLADQQGGDREEVLTKVGAGRPLGRLAQPAGDRRRDRLPVLGSGELRHRRCLERGWRHGADHRLREATAPSSNVGTMPELAGQMAHAYEARIREQEEQTSRRWPSARTRRAGGRGPRRNARCARRSSATATGLSTRRPSGA